MGIGRGGARPGAGRKAGVKNRLTSKVKATLSELAGQHTEAAINTLVEVMQNKKETGAARVSAANSILDRAHGKPVPIVPGEDDEEAPAMTFTITARKAVADVRVTKPE